MKSQYFYILLASESSLLQLESSMKKLKRYCYE